LGFNELGRALIQYRLGGLEFFQALLLVRDICAATALTDKRSFLVEARQTACLDPDATMKAIGNA